MIEVKSKRLFAVEPSPPPFSRRMLFAVVDARGIRNWHRRRHLNPDFLLQLAVFLRRRKALIALARKLLIGHRTGRGARCPTEPGQGGLHQEGPGWTIAGTRPAPGVGRGPTLPSRVRVPCSWVVQSSSNEQARVPTHRRLVSSKVQQWQAHPAWVVTASVPCGGPGRSRQAVRPRRSAAGAFS